MDVVLNLAGEPEAVLMFWWITDSLEPGEFVALDIYDGSWHLDVISSASTGKPGNFMRLICMVHLR